MTASEVKDKLEQATRLYVQADKEGNKASKLTMIPGVHSEGRFGRTCRKSTILHNATTT